MRAERLGADPAVVGAAVGALSKVFVDSVRNRCTPADLRAGLTELRFPEAQAAAVTAQFEAQMADMTEALAQTASSLPEYAHLDWRLEVELASRHRLRVGAEGGAADLRPSFLVRLDLRPAGNARDLASKVAESEVEADPTTTSLYASADYAVLRRVRERLEAALAEAGSGHARRVIRYVR